MCAGRLRAENKSEGFVVQECASAREGARTLLLSLCGAKLRLYRSALPLFCCHVRRKSKVSKEEPVVVEDIQPVFERVDLLAPSKAFFGMHKRELGWLSLRVRSSPFQGFMRRWHSLMCDERAYLLPLRVKSFRI